MLIKYEDLIEDRKKILVSVINFIQKITNSKITIDLKKLDNTINTTSFDYLQNLEKTNPRKLFKHHYT